ncbi:MAG TPA: prepilin-type N-terminal cleavage/methylation domain-containing protein [Candidatus Saccharimonadales bacterium]|nr:prepilin-type N-terminal cleavage/methylation domain-containing protein [Candidatus Saccharimonadales bacterium]
MNKKRRNTRIQPQQHGFTIMEVMIATIVFGVVLIAVTTAIMNFSRVYYKGVTESTVQDTARTVSDLIAQGIQFNGGDISITPVSPTAGSSYKFCIGNKRYSYQVGYKVVDSAPTGNQRYHGLVVDDFANCTASALVQSMGTQSLLGRELLSPNMRLAAMEVTNVSGNLYKIHVKIAYGDDDLLNNPTASTATCKNIRFGTQFCAVSDITTTVVKRVE